MKGEEGKERDRERRKELKRKGNRERETWHTSETRARAITAARRQPRDGVRRARMKDANGRGERKKRERKNERDIRAKSSHVTSALDSTQSFL